MAKVASQKSKKKVLVALSGGIDSAVSAALLLQQGYTVEAAFMKNWSSTEGLIKNECPWLDDRREALKVAAFLKIPLHTFDFEKEYGERVMQYFFEEYRAGRTPNPDVMCNKEIKFKLLYERAMQLGFDYLATGHYAQLKKTGTGKSATLQLVRSKDEFKDQTYFIYNIQPQQFNHILFPVGGYTKPKIKEIAKKLELPNNGRKESMGLCFVGKVQLEKFLAQKIKNKPGKTIDLTGKQVGTHRGVAFYTLGQRQGLEIGGTGPWYVMRKDLAKNELVVSNDPNQKEFLTDNIEISSVNWLVGSASLKFPLKCKGRFRHQQELQDLTIKLSSQSAATPADNIYQVKFAKKQRAVASGQSLVLYSGRTCLGGGVIV